MITSHSLGFPRMGPHRETKTAVEAYWKGRLDRPGLEEAGRSVRRAAWRVQAEAGLDLVPVGDFSWYDHVLDTTAMLGAIPERFGPVTGDVDLDTMFRMARGRAPTGPDAQPCGMTKWFDTNYHYIVPELTRDMPLLLSTRKLLDEVDEAREQVVPAKPVLLGPMTWLGLGKVRGEPFDRLELLPRLLPVYREVLAALRGRGIAWVQVDEPILGLDLPEAWKAAFRDAYEGLAPSAPHLLVAIGYGRPGDNLDTAMGLPVAGLHVDAVRDPDPLDAMLSRFPADKVLSLGIVDGRNVWRTDPDRALSVLGMARQALGDRLWIAPSSSLQHVPWDLAPERHLDGELRSWLAFATQKVREVALLKAALLDGPDAAGRELEEARAAARARRTSPRVHRPEVDARVSAIDPSMTRRAHPYPVRRVAQAARLHLPDLPTTTIGSFPQTARIRAQRKQHKEGTLSDAGYRDAIRAEIAEGVRVQEELGLDVLVHGEAERNDMVEYFGERLEGFAFTDLGWVQSYGSRCVKPPILFGDVRRPGPMTVEWSSYAQSLTGSPMKGMLTGPVTILQWSFVRDDQPRSRTAMQIALALRDEVLDLEKAGIPIVQIDEPAFREGLPLRRDDWGDYLDWAVRAFRVTASGVRDDTQIHTHMCYSEFNDTIEAIADLDADVISIEASRSGMELLGAFERFEYPNGIGPGVYDVHSPLVPSVGEIRALVQKAAARIPRDRLWVNPDCGLKTRDWPEVTEALRNLVAAARSLRDVEAQGR
jgi:5-methyltetrahydropteroyltriglutamate--homocysteine methyltransferase